MSLHPEPISYVKGILSDLQGAWSSLRETVIKSPASEINERLLFHIDEGMSWGSVRDLTQMQKAIIVISNLVNQENLSNEIAKWDPKYT
jgi:hypothetical protein